VGRGINPIFFFFFFFFFPPLLCGKEPRPIVRTRTFTRLSPDRRWTPGHQGFVESGNASFALLPSSFFSLFNSVVLSSFSAAHFSNVPALMASQRCRRSGAPRCLLSSLGLLLSFSPPSEVPPPASRKMPSRQDLNNFVQNRRFPFCSHVCKSAGPFSQQRGDSNRPSRKKRLTRLFPFLRSHFLTFF